MMLILLKIILAHLIGDFLLQPKKWVEEKEKKKIAAPKLYLHVILHGLLVFLFLWNLQLWLFALTIVVVHLIIDVFKLYIFNSWNKIIGFLTDQLLHILSLILLWYFWFQPNINFNALWNQPLIWISITAIVFVTVVSDILVKVLLSSFKIEITEKESLPYAGKYIGMLERLLTFLFIISGRLEAVGFLLAAKSVFRFGDLKEAKNRKLTEYVMIGTLLSFSIAIITGIFTLKIITGL